MSIQPQEYEALVEKLFDDRLSDEELQRLNRALRRSPEAREHYWHLVMLEGYLTDLPGWIAGQQYATQLAFAETLEAFIEMESNAEAELQSYPPSSASITDDQTPHQPITWRDIRTVGAYCARSLMRQKAAWGVAAAAMITVVALVYAIWFSGSPTQPPPNPIAGLNPDRPQEVPPPVESLPIAVVLNHFMGSEGSSEKTIPASTEFAQGQAIALQAGDAMQLGYQSGASVILQGPGSFELLSAERVGMKQGRITATVPPRAKGFTISTPQTDFIDHGTEFAVTLDGEGHGEVVVLDGLIEARRNTTGKQQTLGEPERVMLSEGVGARLVPGEVLPKSVESIDQFELERYARNWDDVVYRPQISGEITYVSSPPASLELGQANSTAPLLIPERRGVVLAEDLHLNSNKTNRSLIQKTGAQVGPEQDYVIAAGTKLNSFLIHFNKLDEDVVGTIERDFKINFSGRIVGIIEMHTYQFQTDELFGLASVQYPGTDTLRGASDPPGHPNYDVIYVSDDLRTLSVKMRLTGMDQIRVLVENTDP